MTRTHFRSIAIALSVAATGMGAVLYAQIQGDRGVPPISSESDFAVPGVKVDVSGDSGAQARDAAWRLAQRKGRRLLRSEERRAGKEGVSTYRSRGSPYH